MKLSKLLRLSLQTALSQYDPGLDEEQGGFILVDGAQYEFVGVKNANTGTTIAHGLYTADKKEFAEKVLSKVMEGWSVYASFHTHPKGFPARPSQMDINQLFTGHPINFIYAPLSDELNMFTLTDELDGKYWTLTAIEHEHPTKNICQNLTVEMCGKCGVSPAEADHVCPYSEEMGGHKVCNCCPSCRRECLEDI